MGTNGDRLEAFDNQTHPRGIHLGMSVIKDDQGTYIATAASQFRQGQWLRKVGDNVTQVTAATDRPLGVAKHNKITLGTSLFVDRALVVGAAAATVSVGRGSIVANSLTMRTVINMGGLVVHANAGGDTAWTLNETTGVLTWGAGGGATNLPAVGTTVFVTYTYNLTAVDDQFDGTNYRTTQDDVTRADNRIAVISGWSRLFLTEYETGVAYGAADGLTYSVDQPLYLSAGARVTNVSAGGAKFLGNVFQLPTSGFRYMGVTLHGDPVA